MAAKKTGTNTKKSTGTRTASGRKSTGSTKTGTRKSSQAKKRTSPSKKSSRRRSRQTAQMQEALALLTLACCVLLFLADLGLLGSVGPALKTVNLGIFGGVGYLMPVLLFLGICYLISNEGNYRAWLQTAGMACFIFALCGLAQLFFGESGAAEKLSDYYHAGASGHGGGFFGGVAMLCFQKSLGDVGTIVVLLVIALAGLVLMTEWSFTGFIRTESKRMASSREQRHSAREKSQEDWEAERSARRELQQTREELREARRQQERQERIRKNREEVERIRRQTEQARAERQTDLQGTVKNAKPETKQTVASPKQPEVTEAKTPEISQPVWQPQPERSSAVLGEAATFQGNQFFGNDLYREEPEEESEEPAVSAMDEEAQPEEQPVSFAAEEPEATSQDEETWNPRWKKETDQIVTFQPIEPEIPEVKQPEADASPQSSSPFSWEMPEIEDLDFAEEVPEEQPSEDPEYESKEEWSVSDPYEAVEAEQISEPEYEAYEDVLEETEEAPAWSVPEQKQSIPERKQESEPSGEGTEYKTVQTASGKVIRVELDGVPGARKLPKDDPPAEKEPKTRIVPMSVPQKEYEFPSLVLLKKNINKTSKQAVSKELRETAAKLQQTLQSFGVGVTVTNASCGPAVTRYELQPEQGVKVSKIIGLADDIKLNLAATDIRIEAPIPGKSLVGIEVPNKENSMVGLRELLESEEFRTHKSRLAFGVGKDIGGQVIIGDISKMPHLLIAGATGSGKSVCINTLIISLLYKSSPADVKMIMIDPKVVELSVYNGIPHLLIPVVTEPKKAAGALNWAVAEMTGRYEKFAQYGVRNINGYNEKIRTLGDDIPEKDRPEKMPHIVIIVDELADLMMVAPGDVEDAICRLAQLARAAGIHLVIATQRPSVNVITGLIKANIPSRIAFAVSSSVDSRTIIDIGGAEKLLGRGDMLYYPQGLQKPIRVQGAFVSDAEVSAVVESLTSQKDVIGGGTRTDVVLDGAGSSAKGAAGPERDELFLQAARAVLEKDKASIGNLQRMFRIGFNRAARIMDQLAEAGVVGEDQGTKPRQILMSPEQFETWAEENL